MCDALGGGSLVFISLGDGSLVLVSLSGSVHFLALGFMRLVSHVAVRLGGLGMLAIALLGHGVGLMDLR